MIINMMKLPVRDLIQGYSEDDATSRVRAWGGKLDVRPEYQREFVYADDKRDAVINTILKGFPLNIMYFVDRKDGTYEVLDGQQRIISICRYATNKYSVKVPAATGGFNTVNYPNKYLNGDYIRQAFLETAFRWAADAEGITGKDAVEQYMQQHRNDKNADALWKYFEDVFRWVKDTFGKNIDPSMKGVQWGLLYNQHRNDNLDPAYMQKRMKELLADKEVGKRSGIYQYLLEGETSAAEKWLSLRQFDKDDMAAKYHEQGGLCAICGKPFDQKDMQGDHIVPWSKGGKTEYSNLQMLCVPCNLAKSSH